MEGKDQTPIPFKIHLQPPLESYYLTQTLATDQDDIIRIFNIKDVSFQLYRPPFPYTLEDFQEFLENVKSPSRQFIDNGTLYTYNWALRNSEGRFIGSIGCGIGGENALPQLGYYLDPAYHRKGLISAAAEICLQTMTKIHGWTRVESGAFADNPASRATLVRLGFHETGEKMLTLRKDRGGGERLETLYARDFPSVAIRQSDETNSN